MKLTKENSNLFNILCAKNGVSRTEFFLNNKKNVRLKILIESDK